MFVDVCFASTERLATFNSWMLFAQHMSRQRISASDCIMSLASLEIFFNVFRGSERHDLPTELWIAIVQHCHQLSGVSGVP